MRLIIQEHSELNKLVELIPITRGRLQVTWRLPTAYWLLFTYWS